MRPHTNDFPSPDLTRVAFGCALVAVGLTHLVFGEAVARTFPNWPEWLPGRPWWAHVAGGLLAACGAMIAMRSRRGMREAAYGIAAIMLMAVLFLHLPSALRSGTFGGAWSNVFKWSAMATGALLVAGRWALAARGALAVFMVSAGILHVRYAAFVVTLMPEWIGGRLFWTYFTAATLAAGGIGLFAPQPALRQLAARLSAVMFLGFFVLVHIPRTLAAPRAPHGWAELGESLAFCAIALMLAERGAITPRSDASA